MNFEDLLRDANVLADHYWQERGMSVGSADRCSCGAWTIPFPGDTEAGERRAQAFAQHQAEMLAIARGDLP